MNANYVNRIGVITIISLTEMDADSSSRSPRRDRRRPHTTEDRKIPYYANPARELERLRRSPPRETKNLPYFADSVRERDRLRNIRDRGGRPQTPPSRWSRSRRSRSRSAERNTRRYRSRSRSNERRHRRHRSTSSESRKDRPVSSSSHRRRRRSRSRSRSPRIITVPVPVPARDFNYGYGWLGHPPLRHQYFNPMPFGMAPRPPLPPRPYFGPYPRYPNFRFGSGRMPPFGYRRERSSRN